MPLRSLALQLVAWLALAFWVGGFMFYSAVVIPLLHEDLGSIETGYVTQRVTDYLNAAGAAALTIWWLIALVERHRGPVGFRRARLGGLLVSTGLLAALVILHRVMDAHLETGSLRGFYPLHRAYLIASTAQWVANLVLMAASIRLGSARDVAESR